MYDTMVMFLCLDLYDGISCHILYGTGRLDTLFFLMFPPFFLSICFLGFFRFLSFIECVCRACRIQCDDTPYLLLLSYFGTTVVRIIVYSAYCTTM